MSEAEENKDELDTLIGSQKTSANGTDKQGFTKFYQVSLTHNVIHNINSIIKGIKHYSAAVRVSITVKTTTISTKDKLQLQDFNCE